MKYTYTHGSRTSEPTPFMKQSPVSCFVHFWDVVLRDLFNPFDRWQNCQKRGWFSILSVGKLANVAPRHAFALAGVGSSQIQESNRPLLNR